MVAVLQRQVGAGRLTLEEFSDRAAAAYRARTLGELAGLTKDLPADPPVPPVPPVPPAASSRRLLVPVLAVLTLLIVGALLALAGPAGAMMGHIGAGC